MLNTETSLGTMWSNLPWFAWHMAVAPFPPFAAPYLSMDPMTKANVVVTQFAQQVHKVSNSWILNSLWNMDTWLYNHHRLSSCLWGFINNAAHCEEAIRGEFFPNPSPISLDASDHFSKGSNIFQIFLQMLISHNGWCC